LAVDSAPADYLEANPYDFTGWKVCAGQREAFHGFGISGVPHFMVLDGEGGIRYWEYGAPINDDAVGRVLDMLIAEREFSQSGNLYKIMKGNFPWIRNERAGFYKKGEYFSP